MIFRKWGGGVKGRLELFRKFIRFGRDRLPLVLCVTIIWFKGEQIWATQSGSYIFFSQEKNDPLRGRKQGRGTLIGGRWYGLCSSNSLSLSHTTQYNTCHTCIIITSKLMSEELIMCYQVLNLIARLLCVPVKGNVLICAVFFRLWKQP